ncbi:GNAT family N-acetyltransferase [Kineosporia sp. J2-2]|uniref:GNAT family N-acetyltransferase n=1 Tax=Kineosporia corallincola TaxID=2835133 RepID=A0ABS5THE0_9ACTN|nr:GNAT family N-acetyltransferase [Kineosporia corallincola]MBT0770455.1 GNAT family N-acetyltransferase [Kineosporia corallincola]
MATPRPDALDLVLPGSTVHPFTPSDLAELVVLQRCCWVSEAILNETLDVPALHETHEQVLAWAAAWKTFVVRLDHRLVAAVRGRPEGSDWHVGRLMVAPDLSGRGIGSALLTLIERAAPEDTERFVLFTGGRSVRNIRTYERAGYAVDTQASHAPGHIAGAVILTKTSAVEGDAC